MGRAFLFRLLFGASPHGLRASDGHPARVGLTPAEVCRELPVHRPAAFISNGADALGRSAAPPAKLSAEDAARCFNVEQGGRMWS